MNGKLHILRIIHGLKRKNWIHIYRIIFVDNSAKEGNGRILKLLKLTSIVCNCRDKINNKIGHAVLV